MRKKAGCEQISDEILRILLKYLGNAQILPPLFFFFFCEMGSCIKLTWPQTLDPPASVSQVLVFIGLSHQARHYHLLYVPFVKVSKTMISVV